MSFGFSGEVAFIKGEQRRTAGGKALEKPRAATDAQRVSQTQSSSSSSSSSMFNGRDDSDFSNSAMPTGTSIKRPPPQKQLVFDPSVSQQQRGGASQNNAAKRSANTPTMAAPKKPAAQRALTFGQQQRPSAAAQPQSQSQSQSQPQPKSALRTSVAMAASRRVAAAAAAAPPPRAEWADEQPFVADDVPVTAPVAVLPVAAPVAVGDGGAAAAASAVDSATGRKMIDAVAQNVLQEMRGRVQSCTTDLRNLLAQIASVRSNMPSIAKIADLHTAAQKILTTHAGFETRIDGCDTAVRACTAQVDEAKLRSYWVYATVTADALPLYDSENPGAGDHGSAHSTLACGTRVLVEFPSQQCGNPADVSDAKYVRTRLVDHQSGESTLFWLPVQGNGRFWEREALAAVDPKAVDTTPSRYLADFSTQP